MTDQRPTVDTARLVVDDPTYVEAGVDFRPGTRSFETGILGQTHLFIDGTELQHNGKLPVTFELMDTATALFELLQQYRTDGRAAGEPVCCACGNRGCAYIQWELREHDGAVLWRMMDFGERPIGAGEYTVDFETLCDVTLDAVETVLTTVPDGESTNAVAPFERYREQIRAWQDSATT